MLALESLESSLLDAQQGRQAGRQEVESPPDGELIAKARGGTGPCKKREKRRTEACTSSPASDGPEGGLPASATVVSVYPALAVCDDLCSVFTTLSRGELLDVDVLISPISQMRKGTNREGNPCPQNTQREMGFTSTLTAPRPTRVSGRKDEPSDIPRRGAREAHKSPPTRAGTQALPAGGLSCLGAEACPTTSCQVGPASRLQGADVDSTVVCCLPAHLVCSNYVK